MTATITAGPNPPWPEYLVSPPHLVVDAYGAQMRRAHHVCAIDPTRPMEWHEIVRDDRVVMRSQRPVAVLLTVLQPGESIYRARRLNRPSSVLDVRRRLVTSKGNP